MRIVAQNKKTPEGALWWLEAESNRRHADFQSAALPTELSSHVFLRKRTISGFDTFFNFRESQIG